jgi:hypothetical protein
LKFLTTPNSFLRPRTRQAPGLFSKGLPIKSFQYVER